MINNEDERFADPRMGAGAEHPVRDTAEYAIGEITGRLQALTETVADIKKWVIGLLAGGIAATIGVFFLLNNNIVKIEDKFDIAHQGTTESLALTRETLARIEGKMDTDVGMVSPNSQKALPTPELVKILTSGLEFESREKRLEIAEILARIELGMDAEEKERLRELLKERVDYLRNNNAQPSNVITTPMPTGVTK